MEIGRDEYWFLENVVNHPLALHLLESGRLERMTNKRGHGLSHDTLSAILFSLFKAGYIYAQRRPIGNRFQPTHVDIEDGLLGKEVIEFGLTSHGGTKWEQLSRPQWTQYWDDRYTDNLDTVPPEIIVEITTGEKALIEQYLDFAKKCEVFVPGTEKWDEVTPWEPTYWKTLPIGHRLQFTCQGFPVMFEISGFREWLSTIRNWYTNPYE